MEHINFASCNYFTITKNLKTLLNVHVFNDNCYVLAKHYVIDFNHHSLQPDKF